MKPLGAPPKTFSDQEKAAWREIAKNATPGTLGNSDRIAVEIAVKMLVRFRSGIYTKASEVAVLISMLSRLGMTPTDRTKLVADGQPSKAAVHDNNDEWTVIQRSGNGVRATGS